MSEVFLVVRTAPDLSSNVVHVGSSVDECKKWCDRRLASSHRANLDVLYDYPPKIVWEDGKAHIGKRGYLTIERWRVDGDVWEIGEVLR